MKIQVPGGGEIDLDALRIQPLHEMVLLEQTPERELRSAGGLHLPAHVVGFRAGRLLACGDEVEQEIKDQCGKIVLYLPAGAVDCGNNRLLMKQRALVGFFAEDSAAV